MGVGQQTVVADFDKARRQQVQAEAAQKLGEGQLQGLDPIEQRTSNQGTPAPSTGLRPLSPPPAVEKGVRSWSIGSKLAAFDIQPSGTRFGAAMSTKQVWFLNTSVTFRVSQAENQDGVSVLEHRVPPGDSPPLHIHRTEDEIFCILEGEFRLKLKDAERRVGPGDTLVVRKGTPHTYRAVSPRGGRFLTVTVRGDFERFVRAQCRPAEHAGLPGRGAAPSPEAMQGLSEAARQHGIEIVGPPLD